MTVKNLREMPWIGERSVLDLANTVVVGVGRAGGDVDLLADPELLASWREKVLDRELADLPREDLAELRAPVRAVLEAAARQVPLPEPARVRLNVLAARVPVTFRVDGAGQLAEQEAGGPAGGRSPGRRSCWPPGRSRRGCGSVRRRAAGCSSSRAGEIRRGVRSAAANRARAARRAGGID
ncbi:ABATE domain-containing protein [Streptomyces sp. YPW6]|uniref:ABATE domain-containing protein n=1 Tax=Streptomyces sp. YPW6 TaxID=2840373 RepID=UPI00209A82B0|nr:ABATE domain-containing protein [Streptomyces sp. YPW6]